LGYRRAGTGRPELLEQFSTAHFATAAFYVDREVERARKALARCIAEEHTSDEDGESDG
jgi:hypothetical protein